MSGRIVTLGAGLSLAGGLGVAFYGGQHPTSQIFGAQICRNPAAGRKLALSFDDGPNPRFTPKLLEVLERFDARATFFPIGKWADREPALLREIHSAGHAVGNHTHTHPNMARLSSAAVKDELSRCRAAVEASGVEFSKADGSMLMRPPYGLRRPGTLRAVRAEGYEPVIWSVTCFDWRRTATKRSIARHAGRAGEGDIILMHDGSDLEPSADRSRTLAATVKTLQKYATVGFEFVTIPELVRPA